MKRITKYLLIFVFVLSVFTLAACGKVKVSDITIVNSAITLEVEETEQINVTVLPEDAADKSVTFVSETPEIATVSDSGLVTAVAVGSTKIAVKAGKIEKEVTVTVIEKGPEALDITAALALENESELTVKGQVVGIQGTQAWIADSGAGISLYQIPEAEMAKIVIGNVIVVTGKRADYSGTKQISSITEVIVLESGKPAMASINLTDLSEAKLNASKQRLIKGTFEVTKVPSAITYNEDGTLANHLTYKMTDGTNEVIFYVKKYLPADTVTAMKDVLEAMIVGGEITFDKAVVTWFNSVPQVLVLTNSTLSYTAPVVVDVTGLEVTNTVVKLDAEATEQIVYKVLPENATDKSVTFTSSDETVATVSEDGLITGVAVGEATITVKAKTFTKEVTVTVTEKPLTIAEALAVENGTEVLFKGQVIGTQGSQAWLSDGEAGISLYQIPSDQMEKIVVGNVIVVAGKRADYSGTKQIGSITLVEVRETEKPPFASIVLEDLVKDNLDNTLQQLIWGSFEVSAVPAKIEYNEDGTLKNHLTYKIINGDNEVVFYVKKYLSLEAVTAMKDTLEAIELGGIITFDKAVISWFNSNPQVMVLNETEISFIAPADPTSVVIKPADEFALNVAKQLEAIAIPAGKLVTYEWSVNNEAIATISATGELTFLAPGEVVVSVKVVEFPTLTASRTFTVVAPEPTDITIEGDSKVIIKDSQTYQYVATVNPEAALQTVIWSVNDITKATVDANGVLTPIAEGSVQLTATSTVNDAITRIKFVQIENYIEPKVTIKGSPMVSVGIETPFSATVASNFLSKKVVWSINNEAIATISETGVVTGLTVGTAIVTATSVDDALLKATFEVEVIEISHKNMVIDATINDDTAFELTYGDVVYYKGINAFADFAAAAALVQDGAIIYVLPGEYTQKATINASDIQILGPNAGVNPVTAMESRTSEAVVQVQLTFGTKSYKPSNITIDGLKFTDSGSVFGPYGIDQLTVTNVHFTNPSINPAQGMIYLSSPTIDVTSNDLVVEDSYFDDSNFLGYRGIRLNNTINITIKNNYFFKFYDAIRIEDTNNGGFNIPANGIGAAGEVLISNNEFDMNRQYPIVLTVVSATKVDIIHNTISSDFVAGGTWGQVYLSNLNPAAGTKTIVNIKYNTFLNMNNYHSVRIKSNGNTSESLEYNVNFNKWLVKNNDEESYIYCAMAEGDVDLVTDASNNYYPVTPTATDFTNVKTFEPFFTDLEAFELAKSIDLGEATPVPTAVEISPAEGFVLNEEKQLEATVLPAGTTATFEWSVDVPAIATISTDGKLTFIAYGEVIVTVKLVEYPEITASITYLLEEEVIGENKNILIDATIGAETPTEIIYDLLTYTKGVNAFATFAEAAAVVQDGAIIYVFPGEYAEDVTFTASNIQILGPNRGVNPVTNLAARTEEAIITKVLTLGTSDVKPSNVSIDGLKFTGGGSLYAPFGIDVFKASNLWFTDSNIDGTRGMIYIAAPTIAVSSTDVVIEDSVFDDSKFTAARGVRLNNTINITIKDNYFFKFYDAIRIESTNNGGFNQSPTGIGAAGIVSISGNEFEMTFQYNILLTVVSATEVNVNNNVIGVDPASTTTNGQVYMSNIVPNDGIKTVINVKYNTFTNANDYHSVRLKSHGCTNETLEYNVNYNKWLAGKKATHTYVVCTMVAGDVDLVTDASNNYFAVEPLAAQFTNVKTFEPFFTDLEAFEIAKTVDMQGFDPMKMIVDPSMDKIADEKFEFGGVPYKVGETAFVSISEALSKLQSGATLLLRTGTYDQAFAITVPNVTVKAVEGEVAVITNKIILTGSNGITLTNLEFTGLGQVYATGAFDNFVFDNNKVYDSTIEASAYFPSNRTDVNAFIQLYSGSGSNVLGNITITNNIFNGMTSDIIALDRTSAGKTITITDNEFRNFGVGAIRFDGGYTNGTYNLLRNIFENDVLGGSAAIVFRAYSAAAGETQTINIEDNFFKNIGDLEYQVSEEPTYPASAVITTSTFNDKNVTLNIKNNKFINNVNDLHIRNVGALSSTWTGNINNNEFIGTKGYVYYENADLADFNYNYYEDAEGNAITDLTVLATLIQNNTKYANLRITAKYEGDTGNLIDGNNALTVGLPEALFTVEAIKNDPSNNVGINKAGQIRLYTDRNTGNGNTLKISIVEGYVITSVKFTFGSGSNSPTAELIYGTDAPLSLTTEQLTNTINEYSGSIADFSIKNTQTGGTKNAQIYILSIDITYTAVS